MEGAEPGPAAAVGASEPPRIPAVSGVLALLAVYTLFRWAVGTVRLPLDTPFWLLALAYTLTAAGAIGLPIAALAALARATRSAPVALGIMAGGLLLWLGLLLALPAAPRPTWGLIAALQDLGKILAAGGVGIALATRLREPNILVPAGLFAAFADFVVVHFGTVKHALSTPKGQALIEAVSARVPSMHPALGAGVTIGPADFLFLGIFLACAARFGMGVRRNAVVLTVVLALSLMLVPFVRAIPALAPMALAFLAANWARFRLTREELRGTVVVLILAGGLFLGYFLFLFPVKR